MARTERRSDLAPLLSKRPATRFVAPAILIAIGIAPVLLRGDEAWTTKLIDPHKVVKAARCGHCHESEFAVWKKSEHELAANGLAAKPSAIEIARRMGTRSIQRNSLCLECHYTPVATATGDIAAASGVSCESCHGAAKDWVDLHNSYGGGVATYKTETPEHRQQRINGTQHAGMFRPSNVYDVAQNCYRCHTVPHEALVNRGEHGSGSDFVLPEWFEKVSHNYLQSMREGDGTQERKLTQAEKRVLWVVGWGLDLEYSVRGMANATEEGVFLKAMERRGRDARTRLEDIRVRQSLPQLDSILAIATSVPVAPNRSQEDLQAADRIGAQTRAFVAAHDGTDLGPIDTLLAGWRPQMAASPVADVAMDSLAVNSSAQHAVGQVVAHVDPSVPGHKAIGASACGKCHGKPKGWWMSDSHANAANLLLQPTRRALQIASYYGLSTADMRSTDRLCMDCHAGRGALNPEEGVACEACHGPGLDYKGPHQDGDKSLGLERPGYKKGLALGMVDLRRAEPMANDCVRCHYITQDRLISSGHPTGAKFNLAAAHARIKHWERSLASDATLQSAYATAIKKRGQIPTVAIVGPALHDTTSTGSSPTGATDVTLGPFPELPPNASLEEILVAMRDRLRALHKVTVP